MFTISEDQYNALLARITALEHQANDVVVAIDKFITLSQMHSVQINVQRDLTSLSDLVAALSSRVNILENEPTS
jgi:hypothetical protein